jgi:hypothetical protein
MFCSRPDFFAGFECHVRREKERHYPSFFQMNERIQRCWSQEDGLNSATVDPCVSGSGIAIACAKSIDLQGVELDEERAAYVREERRIGVLVAQS